MHSPCPNILLVISDAILAHPCVFLKDRGCQEEDASVRYELQASALFCMGPMMALLWSHRFFPTLRCFLLASFPSAGPGSCDRCDVTTHHAVWEVYYTRAAWGFPPYNSCTPYTPAIHTALKPSQNWQIKGCQLLVCFFSTIFSFFKTCCDTRFSSTYCTFSFWLVNRTILLCISCPFIYLVARY